MRLFDAHNHLQDNRLPDDTASMMAECTEAGLVRMVVNGTHEADWERVADLAKRHDCVLPSFGLHPWFVHERSADWLARLVQHLDAWPSAVGEIGLDRWKPGLPYDEQEEVFLAQLNLAAERNLAASIHCLKSWGRLLELLRRTGHRIVDFCSIATAARLRWSSRWPSWAPTASRVLCP